MHASLLDESIPINLDLLDDCVQKMYQGNKECSDICNGFMSRQDSFDIVTQVLQSERSYLFKVYALSIFAKFVELRWDTLSLENKAELRNFISSYITTAASFQDETLQQDKVIHVLRYADIVLINVLKYDWPKLWPNFIPDLIQAAGNSPDMCANCFFILRGLAQEFSNFIDCNTLSSSQQAEMIGLFNEQFGLIIPVIEFALDSTDNPNLINTVLCSLKTFLETIDESIFLGTGKIFSTICEKLLPDHRFTINCISVFGELVSRTVLLPDLNIVQLFTATTQCLARFFPVPSPDISFNIYSVEVPDRANFIHLFTSSMSSFIKSYQQTLEASTAAESYFVVLQWMFNVTQNADSDDIDFSTCMNMWHSISRNVYTDMANTVSPIYNTLFPALRRLCISRMVCPNEVIYIIDDDGIHSHKNNIQSQNSITYTNMREMLVYLTHLDQEDMLNALLEKIGSIKESTDLFADINSLCWAAGCLGTGALEEISENKFFVTLLDCLLSFFSTVQQPLIQASLACGILYVCSQYGRILEKCFDLLKVVMFKLFDFMQEKSMPQVQESAIEAMKKIVRRCGFHIVMKQENEESSLFEIILRNSETLFQSLSLNDIIEMYEVYAILIPCIIGEPDKEQVLNGISGTINQQLSRLVENINPFDESWYDGFNFIIQCNIRLSKYLGNIYISQFQQILPMLVQIYKFVSGAISQVSIESQQRRLLMHIKASILELLSTAINMINRQDFIIETVFPLAMDYFLPEYAQNENGRSPSVLTLFGSLTSKLSAEISQNLPTILSSLFSPTLQYLTDYSENFDFWLSFSIFLSILISRVPQFLTELNKEQLDFFIEALKRCCNHPQVEISERSLMTFADMLCAFENITTIQFASDFMNCYSLDLLHFVMELMTDSIHKYAFNELMGLLRKLFSSSSIKAKKVEVFNMFTTLYPNRPPAEIGQLIESLFQTSSTYYQFKSVLRDFLIVANKYAKNDPAIYKAEKEEIEKQLEEKKEVRGLVADSKEITDNLEQLVNLAANFEFPK